MTVFAPGVVGEDIGAGLKQTIERLIDRGIVLVVMVLNALGRPLSGSSIEHRYKSFDHAADFAPGCFAPEFDTGICQFRIAPVGAAIGARFGDLQTGHVGMGQF